MNPKKHLSFGSLRHFISQHIRQYPDWRQEHNFGHGRENLCFNVYLFILLAFSFHQIFELTDRLYQACRKMFGSKRHMWDTIRAAIKWFVFNSWELLLSFVLAPERYMSTLLTDSG
jgi:hypothetical protein